MFSELKVRWIEILVSATPDVEYLCFYSEFSHQLADSGTHLQHEDALVIFDHI